MGAEFELLGSYTWLKCCNWALLRAVVPGFPQMKGNLVFCKHTSQPFHSTGSLSLWMELHGDLIVSLPPSYREATGY